MDMVTRRNMGQQAQVEQAQCLRLRECIESCSASRPGLDAENIGVLETASFRLCDGHWALTLH